MDRERLVASLATTPALLRGLFEGVSADGARRHPRRGAWSMLEVLGHLVDEEQEDFPLRLRSTLERPEAPWPPIDPEGRVRDGRFDEQDPEDLLNAFRARRQRSLRWLRRLEAPDWHRAHAHPALGSLRAGDLLAAWVAHDLLHLRQLLTLRLAVLGAQIEPFDAGYAGA